MSEMDLRERTVEGVSIVGLTGELNIHTAPDLRQPLMKYVKKGEESLLLDLTGLRFMDTSGLATLIEAQLKVEKYGGRIVLFGLDAQIRQVFDIVRVSKLFGICATEQEALEAVRKSAG